MKFDFKEIMCQEIKQQIRPLLKTIGFKPGKRIEFVRECNCVLQMVAFCFSNNRLKFEAIIMPLADPCCGSGSYYAIPYKVFETEAGKRVKKYPPSESNNLDEFFALKARDEQVMELCRETALERFGFITEFLVNEIFPVFQEINTLEKCCEVIKDNINHSPPLQVPGGVPDISGKYLFGIYDCVFENFEAGWLKFVQARDDAFQIVKRLTAEVKNYDINNRHKEDRQGRQYMFAQMFVEALEGPVEEQKMRFWKTHEEVCQEMRVWHKLIKPEKKLKT